MTDKIPEFYIDAIYNVFHRVIDIQYPTQRGSQNNVLFVKTADGDFVAKFNTRDMVIKNYDVSHLARQNGILAPDISIMGYKNTWFERYPLIQGKTLFERMKDGMPMPAIKRAFDEILTQFLHMDNLPIQNIRSNKCINVHDAVYANGRNTSGPVLARILMSCVYLMNRGREHNVGLYHTELTPKNVIVDENGKLISLLDIDGMAICNRSFAFSVFADKWAQAGFDLNELYDKYEHMTGRKINRARINAMLNTVHAGKYIMFHTNKNKIK